MANGLNDLGKSYKSLAKSYREKSSPDPYDMAILYKLNVYLEKMDSAGTTVQNLIHMNEELENSFKDGSFKKEAEKLSKNPVFKATLSYNKRDFYKEWADIEKKTEKYIYEMKLSLNDIHNKDVDVSKYIMTGDLNSGHIPTGEKALKSQYNRLGQFVTKDILTDPKHRVIVQAITSGRMDYNEVLKKTTEELKKNHILEKKNFNVADLREMISTEELKNKVVQNIKKQAENNARKRLPSKNASKAKKPITPPAL
jgi:hypothetical protein